MCSSGTHVSWAQAYKAHVEGVSPRCGIEQIREAKAKEHEPKRTIPANWGLRQETLPQDYIFFLYHSCL